MTNWADWWHRAANNIGVLVTMLETLEVWPGGERIGRRLHCASFGSAFAGNLCALCFLGALSPRRRDGLLGTAVCTKRLLDLVEEETCSTWCDTQRAKERRRKMSPGRAQL